MGTEGFSLTESELCDVFDAVNEAIFIYDTMGDVVEVNSTAAERYGYSRETLRSGTIAATSPGDPSYSQEKAERYIQKTTAEESQRFEWQSQDSDGTVFWEEVHLNRATIDGTVRVLARVRDIHERKETKRRFQTLISNLPGIVYRCRNESGWPMEFVGGQCKELTGYDSASIESGSVNWGTDVLHPDDQNEIYERVQDTLTDDEPFEVTYRIQTRSGETRWMWERGRLVDVPGSEQEMLEGFITDITERKKTEQQLEEQRDKLDVLNEVLRHDIRNDLQLVTTYIELVEEKCGNDDVQDHLAKMSDHTDHAVELTTTAREMAEVMVSTEQELHRVDLRAILEEELAEVQSAYPHAEVSKQSDLPTANVRADDLLGSVFRNLLKNAIQHNDKDVPEVTVSARTADGTAIVTVADNGPGIPDDQKEAIFGKGEATLESSGTGVGLYLVETLVESYGGDVSVTDNDPTGSIFRVELPIVDSSKQ